MISSRNEEITSISSISTETDNLTAEGRDISVLCISKDNLMADVKKLLSAKKFYPVFSSATKNIYIDKDGCGFIFTVKKEAEEYINALGKDKGYVEMNPQTVSYRKDIKDYYCLGMKTLKIKCRENGDFIDMPLHSNVAKGYVNAALEFNVTRLKETALKKYLSAMKGNRFLVPVYLPERKKKEYPKVFYCHAVFNDEKKDRREALILFSTMDEFDVWNTDMKKHKRKVFYPLEISSTRTEKVRNGSDIIINPLSDKLLITDKQLKENVENEAENVIVKSDEEK